MKYEAVWDIVVGLFDSLDRSVKRAKGKLLEGLLMAYNDLSNDIDRARLLIDIEKKFGVEYSFLLMMMSVGFPVKFVLEEQRVVGVLKKASRYVVKKGVLKQILELNSDSDWPSATLVKGVSVLEVFWLVYKYKLVVLGENDVYADKTSRWLKVVRLLGGINGGNHTGVNLELCNPKIEERSNCGCSKSGPTLAVTMEWRNHPTRSHPFIPYVDVMKAGLGALCGDDSHAVVVEFVGILNDLKRKNPECSALFMAIAKAVNSKK